MSNAATLAAKANANVQEKDADVLPRLLGHYVLLRLLVRGGMGEVYLATTIGIEGAERPVVVKRIRRDYRSDPSFHARFLDEARVQAQLDDPGVARIIEASVDEHGDPYVVVEYVEGRSLADVRARLSRLGKPLPWADAVAVTLEMASALAHVHERTGADGAPLGIVHRDLSPQNVMIGFSGDVKLIDFGTARGDNRRCHTVSGTVLAKPGYVAPEVARGDSATPRADIYALGVMLWELAAGRRYLEGDASEHVANVTSGKLRPAQLAGDPVLAQLGDGPIPAELDRIVGWLTEPMGSARCGSAREAAQALAGLLSSAPRRPVEERGVRARVKAMLSRLYPTEPAASRVEFVRLVAKARRVLATELSELSPTPSKKRDAAPEHDDAVEQIPDALPGTRYRLIRRLGEGAMGVVYEAEHVDLGRKVAIKLLQAQHSASPEFVARFRREARAIASLSHPNLVHVYDFGQTAGSPDSSEWGGRLFFVMERLEGETLDAFLDREKGMDWRDGCELAIKTCRALEAAHAAGLVHRDLKPANLFLSYQGRRAGSFGEIGLKLLDFGVAKEMRGEGAPPSASEVRGEDDPNLSKAGAIFGTPETMAPEQVVGGEVDGRVDIYALGCVLYQLLTGRMPFDAPSPILMMSMHLREDPRPVREAAPQRGIPEAVERVVMKALSKDRGARFHDASEMREALEEACYGGFYVESNKPATMAPREIPVDLDYEMVFDSAKPEPTSRIDRPRKRRYFPITVAAIATSAIAIFIGTGHKPFDKNDLMKLAERLHLKHAPAMTVAAPTPVVAAPAPVAVPVMKQEPRVSAPVPRAPIVLAQKEQIPAAIAKVDSKPVLASPPPLTSVESKPSDIDAKIAAGETDAALELARAAKEDGTPASAAAWARAAMAAGHSDEAHQACMTWLARDKSSIDARMTDARALRAMGRFDDARGRLEEVLKMKPDHAEAKSMLKDLELMHPKPAPVRHIKKKKPTQKLLG
jgi:eukaryotic-like serine/threonine-protein kinase